MFGSGSPVSCFDRFFNGDAAAGACRSSPEKGRRQPPRPPRRARPAEEDACFFIERSIARWRKSVFWSSPADANLMTSVRVCFTTSQRGMLYVVWYYALLEIRGFGQKIFNRFIFFVYATNKVDIIRL
jgi:hypothetical protein